MSGNVVQTTTVTATRTRQNKRSAGNYGNYMHKAITNSCMRPFAKFLRKVRLKFISKSTSSSALLSCPPKNPLEKVTTSTGRRKKTMKVTRTKEVGRIPNIANVLPDEQGFTNTIQ